MKKKTRSEIRQQGFRPQPLSIVSLRIEPETWEKSEWAARTKGQSRSEWVRDTLANASRGAEPPVPREFRGVSASPAELELWQKSAAYRKYESLEAYARYVMNVVATVDEEHGYE